MENQRGVSYVFFTYFDYFFGGGQYKLGWLGGIRVLIPPPPPPPTDRSLLTISNDSIAIFFCDFICSVIKTMSQ